MVNIVIVKERRERRRVERVRGKRERERTWQGKVLKGRKRGNTVDMVHR